MPILDSVVHNYYRFSISLRDEDLFLRLSAMSWGEFAFSLIAQIRQDLRAVGRQIAEVQRAVAGTPFAGASALRVLESLIWYYYAGR
jgi:hypothetical protein